MSLAQITKETRLILKLGGAAAAVIVIIYLSISGFGIIKNTLFPSPPPPPEEKFGQLPQVEFPVSTDTGPHEYRINTISGALPTFAGQVRVFKTQQNEPSVIDLQEARNRMALARYTAGETKISETVYRWSQPDGSATITYDIISHNFSLTTDYLVNPKYQTSSGISAAGNSIKSVINLLDVLGAHHDDINIENSQVAYSSLVNGKIIPIESAQTAQFTNVNLVQNQIEKMPIAYPGNGSTLNFLLAFMGQAIIIEGNYPHVQVSGDSSTYKVKSAQQAFDNLKNGEAYIIQAPSTDTVDITDVQLAYYIGPEDIGFILPVFVFTGNNFKAYVSAIADS